MAEHAPYDPQKAHEYYERTKKLKGKQGVGGDANVKGLPPKKPPPGSAKSPPPPKPTSDTQTAGAKVERLKSKVAALEGALSEAEAALSAKRQETTKKEKESSDDKSTEKEKQASQKYRDKHQAELKSKEKKDDASSSGGSSSSSSSSKSVSDMSVEELGARIIKIKSALQDAKRQLSSATIKHGQLAHSAITSEPMFNEHFAQYLSGERIPSQ